MKRHLRASEHKAVKGVRIQVINAVVILLSCLFSLALLRAARDTAAAYNELRDAAEKYVACELAANDLKDASNYLTEQVRMFTVTLDPARMELYVKEAMVNRRREAAVDTLEQYLRNAGAHSYLEDALACSNQLIEREYYAMKLIVEAQGYPVGEQMAALNGVTLSPADRALSREEKISLAQSLVYDDAYQAFDDQIDENISLCIAGLIRETQFAQQESSVLLDRLLLRQQVLTVLLLAVVILMILLISLLILWPLGRYVTHITEYETLPMSGAYELRYLAKAYNVMYEEHQKSSARLRHEAEHDPLTGLFNRGAFERLRGTHAGQSVALLLIDVDKFKGINDTYGHDTGDRILKKVASLLSHSFRSTDYPCRIGGDEFAVIMTETPFTLKSVVQEKLLHVREGLADVSDGLPPVTLSIGVAFSDRLSEMGDLYKDADKALYQVKERGRNGYAFYGE